MCMLIPNQDYFAIVQYRAKYKSIIIKWLLVMNAKKIICEKLYCMENVNRDRELNMRLTEPEGISIRWSCREANTKSNSKLTPFITYALILLWSISREKCLKMFQVSWMIHYGFDLRRFL